MSQIVRMGNVLLGEGLPKICVPIVGTNPAEIIESAEKILEYRPDVVEWRMDFFQDVKDPQAVEMMGRKIKAVTGEIPLLCTFRTKAEGGELDCTPEEYREVNRAALAGGFADAIDVELFMEPEAVKSLVTLAHEMGRIVIGSNHDFHKTPEKREIISRLCRMQELGMDVAKMAVMPECEQDVLTLLEATREMKEKHDNTPVITMSMGGKGLISRLAGEVFGAALTFGCVGKASAPGQIPVEELRSVLELVHRYS